MLMRLVLLFFAIKGATGRSPKPKFREKYEFGIWNHEKKFTSPSFVLCGAMVVLKRGVESSSGKQLPNVLI